MNRDWGFWSLSLMVVLGLAAMGGTLNQSDKKPALGAAPGSAQRLSVPNFFCPAEKVATGGQPSVAVLQEAKAQGYRTVINLRTEKEGPEIKAEGEQVRQLGMVYVHIPVEANNPKPSDAEAFLKVVRDEENLPLFIHCGSANRVGGLWMIHRVLDDDWSLERAEKEAQQIGLRSPHLKEFAVKYIEAQKNK